MSQTGQDVNRRVFFGAVGGASAAMLVPSPVRAAEYNLRMQTHVVRCWLRTSLLNRNSLKASEK